MSRMAECRNEKRKNVVRKLNRERVKAQIAANKQKLLEKR